MFKSIPILWKGLATAVVLSILLAACAPSAQTPTIGQSELETPAVEGSAAQAPTAEAGASQAPTIEATSVPTTTAATPTVASSAGVTATTPTATPVSTPSTLPVTGGSDDDAAALSLILIALGVMLLLVGALGFARHPR